MIGNFRGRASRAAVLFVAALSGLMLTASVGGAHAGSVQQVLYSFCTKKDCADLGVMPALARDASGNFYGMTSGDADDGIAYELVRQDDGKYKLATLHQFCNGCAEGTEGLGQVILDVNGAMYGTLQIGGTHGGGVVYKLSPPNKGRAWKLTALYNFCSVSGCADGEYPGTGLTYQGAASGMPYDGVSPLYGTTGSGGAHSNGVLYKLVPQGKGAVQTVLHDFCAQTNCADGAAPGAELNLDGNGNILGVTVLGGAQYNGGAVYQIGQDGAGYTLLYSFCKLANCTDGANPSSALTIDASGNLYGSTAWGGANNLGTVYKLVPNGDKSKLSVVYSFCALSNCADGESPAGALALDGSGDLYGSTTSGGANSHGTIYKISGGGFAKIYDFCPPNAKGTCKDGARPNPPILLDGEGHLFGTTGLGGKTNSGVLYELTP